MSNTVAMAFDEFSALIEPTENEIEKLKNRHQKVREEIGNSLILDKQIQSFLTGSYKRKTLVNPANDVDLMLVLDKDEYWEKFKNEPRKLLEMVKRKLKKISQYQNTTMRIQTHSIGIKFADKKDVDVVPAFIKNYEERIFLIPNHKLNRFVVTSPKQHQNLISNHNKKFPNFTKIIKMLKIWKKKLARQSDNDLRIKSFHLEMLGIKGINKGFSGYKDGVILLFSRIEKLIVNKLEDPIGLSGDISDYLDSSQKHAIQKEIIAINENIKQLLVIEKEDAQKAIKGWNEIFGFPFPKSEPKMKKKKNPKKDTNLPKQGDVGFGSLNYR